MQLGVTPNQFIYGFDFFGGHKFSPPYTGGPDGPCAIALPEARHSLASPTTQDHGPAPPSVARPGAGPLSAQMPART